MTGTKKNCN